MIGYFHSNISAEKCQHWLMYVKEGTAEVQVRTVIFEKEKNCNKDIINQVEINAVGKQSVPQSDDIVNVMKVTSKQHQQPPTEHITAIIHVDLSADNIS